MFRVSCSYGERRCQYKTRFLSFIFTMVPALHMLTSMHRNTSEIEAVFETAGERHKVLGRLAAGGSNLLYFCPISLI